MSEPNRDDELQSLFARRRVADRKGAPVFHAMRTRALETGATPSPSAPPILWRWLLPAGAALVLGITALLAVHHPTPTPVQTREVLARQLNEIDAALQRSLAAQHELTAWQSPTDFLLPPMQYQNRP